MYKTDCSKYKLLKFTEWLEQRDPELFLEVDQDRRRFLQSTTAAAAASVFGGKIFGNKAKANDGFTDEKRDFCAELNDAEFEADRLRKSIMETELTLDDYKKYKKIADKHKSFTSSRVGQDFQRHFPDPFGTIHNPYRPNEETKEDLQNYLDYAEKSHQNNLSTLKQLQDKISRLKMMPTPQNQEEIKHIEKVIDTYNHAMKNGSNAKPLQDYHPHQDYYDDMRGIKSLELNRKFTLDTIADLKSQLQALEQLIPSLRHECEEKIDNILYRKLRSQHSDNTLNISPRDTLFILKYKPKDNPAALTDLANRLGQTNIKRLNDEEIMQLINRTFDNRKYFVTLINVLGLERVKSIFKEGIGELMKNFYKFAEKSYPEYLQDVFTYIVGKKSMINLSLRDIFLILYNCLTLSFAGRLTEPTGELKPIHKNHLSIIIKNIGMYNMKKLTKNYWDDLNAEVPAVKILYDEMLRNQPYSPSIFSDYPVPQY